MLTKFFGRLITAALLGAPTCAALAQSAPPQIIPLVSQDFSERFEGSAPVPVSGNLVVGVQYGELTGPFSIGKLAIATKSGPKSGHLCLSVSSRDGRYSSKNLYRFSGSGELNFDFKSKYSNVISNYKENSVAVLIRDVMDCGGNNVGMILPRGSLVDVVTNILQIAVNAQPERTSIHLKHDGVLMSQAQCSADKSAVSISFSALCRLELPLNRPNGEYVFEVRVREKFEVVTRPYSVFLERP